MPETRKHDPRARDPLDEAIFAALGEPVRPAVPGAEPAGSDTEEGSAPASAAPLGTFTWTVRAPESSGS